VLLEDSSKEIGIAPVETKQNKQNSVKSKPARKQSSKRTH
jgi:hypothetical protein